MKRTNTSLRCIDITLNEPHLILSIASYCLSRELFTVCKQWTYVLCNEAQALCNEAQALCNKTSISHHVSPLRSVVAEMCPADVPALLYELMTWRQKVTLPNHLVKNGQYASTLKDAYMIAWDDVISHCEANIEDIHWLFGAAREPTIVNFWNAYHRCMFGSFDFYRSYCMTNVDSRVWSHIRCWWPAVYDHTERYGYVLSKMQYDFGMSPTSVWNAIYDQYSRLSDTLSRAK